MDLSLSCFQIVISPQPLLVVVGGSIAIFFSPPSASEPEVGNLTYHQAPGRLFTQSFVAGVVVVVVVVDMLRTLLFSRIGR